MRLKIGTRLFLIFSLVSAAILILNAALTRWNFQRDFLAYVEELETARVDTVAERLSDVYASDGGWQRLQEEPRRWHDVLRDAEANRRRGAVGGPPPAHRPGPDSRPRPPPGREKGPPGPPPPGDPLRIGQRYALADAAGTELIGRIRPGEGSRSLPILVDGRTVGTLHVARLSEPETPIDQTFDRQQLQSIYTSLAIAVAISALLSGLFARQLTRPIRALTAGANAIASGDYAARIDTDRGDELGVLAGDFNRLAATLDRNRQLRQQWIADIAHELRTPLSILRGELDALEDGVRSFGTDTRRSLQAEIERLTALVADLHELSTSDEGRLTVQPRRIDLSGLLRDTLQKSAARVAAAGIELSTDLPGEPVEVDADPARLEQLIANLIENSLRYTNSPGRLHVSCRLDGNGACVEFSDSAPGVPDHALERLFDRLYRADASRSRATGGSGLGLAICQAIVDAHGGSIDATHSALGGVTITMRLPAEPS